MRLSDVLSKPLGNDFAQVDGFLGSRTLGHGKQCKITAGKVALSFFCKECNDRHTFCSSETLWCIGINNKLISIDCALKCSRCGKSLVQAWFLIESKEDMNSTAPNIRILKRSERLSEKVQINDDKFDVFTSSLEKAEKAYREGLGAGSVIYLRKIFEEVTTATADKYKIDKKKGNGHRKNFSELLKDVNKTYPLIPREFSDNGYKLFSDLSNVLHSNYKEEEALSKYESFKRLTIGIIENVKNQEEIIKAISKLGWNAERNNND